MINLQDYTPTPVPEDALTVEDRWILSRLATVTEQVTQALESYRYADAARSLYDFAWDEFCSFFVEMLKNRLQDAGRRPVAQRVLASALDTLLRLLHPLIPFITEEIWQLLGRMAPQRGLPTALPAATSIMQASWPTVDRQRQDPEIEARFARFQAVLGALREIRSRQNIAPKNPLEFRVRCSPETTRLLQPMLPYFASMANARGAAWGEDVQPPATGATVHLPEADVYVDLRDYIDVGAEIVRNEKLQQKLLGQIQGKEKKLASPGFVDRAPAEVVQKERDSLAQLRDQLTSVEATLAGLRGSGS